MSYRTTNKQTIERAFKTFSLQADSYIERGMRDIAVAGLEYLVEAHEMYEYGSGAVDENGNTDRGFEFHIHEENTMAYAVAHNGKVISAGKYNGRGNDGDITGIAMEQASAIASASIGWVAIIYSEMDGWYKMEKEQDYQRYSRQQIIAHFHDYFKPVK